MRNGTRVGLGRLTHVADFQPGIARLKGQSRVLQAYRKMSKRADERVFSSVVLVLVGSQPLGTGTNYGVCVCVCVPVCVCVCVCRCVRVDTFTFLPARSG